MKLPGISGHSNGNTSTSLIDVIQPKVIKVFMLSTNIGEKNRQSAWPF